MAKGLFGLTFNGVRDNKDGMKKKSFILEEKREGDNNLLKVHSF